MRQIAEVRNYRELQAVLRARSEEMEITRLASDHESGLPSGYSAKLLAPVPIRNLGMSSLGALLGLLKLKLVVVEDCPKARYYGASATRSARAPFLHSGQKVREADV